MRDPRTMEAMVLKLKEMVLRHAIEMRAAMEIVINEYPNGVTPDHFRVMKMWALESLEEPKP